MCAKYALEGKIDFRKLGDLTQLDVLHVTATRVLKLKKNYIVGEAVAFGRRRKTRRGREQLQADNYQVISIRAFLE